MSLSAVEFGELCREAAGSPASVVPAEHDRPRFDRVLRGAIRQGFGGQSPTKTLTDSSFHSNIAVAERQTPDCSVTYTGLRSHNRKDSHAYESKSYRCH